MIRWMDMNGTALNIDQLPKRGRFVPSNNPSCRIGSRYARHQILNRLAASQSSQRGTLREGQTSIAFVRANGRSC